MLPDSTSQSSRQRVTFLEKGLVGVGLVLGLLAVGLGLYAIVLLSATPPAIELARSLIWGTVGLTTLALLSGGLAAMRCFNRLADLTRVAWRMGQGEIQAPLKAAASAGLWRESDAMDLALKYVQDMAAAAAQLASGEAVSVVPHGEQDELGQALTRAAANVQTATAELEMLALGDISAAIDARSQADRLGRACSQVQAYLADAAAAAERIVQGDLTADIAPQSGQDALGNALAQLMANLRQLVGQVTENAAGLDSASGELADTANQAGTAANQIAGAIRQVTEGISQQTDSVSRTVMAVEQMKAAIDSVARGAEEQGQAVSQASAATAQLSEAIQQMAAAAGAQARGGIEAAEAARAGAGTIEATIEGMSAIQTKTDLAATKVREMGARSAEIGRIVETIEDIAAQTNLLALNAAIEAARAGAQGRGFAVVAGEVRKLAEKSAGANREIADLIRAIQRAVGEAVTAIGESAREVESGVDQTNQAGMALANILKTAEAVKLGAEQSVEVAQRAQVTAEALVKAVDVVGAVGEANTAATEAMTARSMEVTQMVETIAGVSDTNSAAIGAVSTSVAALSAQVAEVTASGRTLTSMAQTLQEVVKQYKYSEGDAAGAQNMIEGFIEGHRKWVKRAEMMLAGGKAIAEREVPNQAGCSLGRWGVGRGRETWGHLPEFSAIEAPHALFHARLAGLVTAATQGSPAAAEEELVNLKRASSAVLKALDLLGQRIARDAETAMPNEPALPAPGVRAERKGLRIR
jgi:methyl-accepting chemotaxis protein